MRTLIFIFSFLALLPIAQASSKSVKVEIFYVPWQTFTSVALQPAQVRKQAAVFAKITGAAEIAKFSKNLQINALTKSDVSPSSDARLVIDFYDDDGRRSTFFADQQRLSSEDGQRSRIINDDFRRMFFSFIAQ